MAKLACRLCMAVAAFAIILQIASCVVPWFVQIQYFAGQNTHNSGMLGMTKYEYEFFLWKLRERVEVFDPLSSSGKLAKIEENFYEECVLVEETTDDETGEATKTTTRQDSCFNDQCKAARDFHELNPDSVKNCELKTKDGWFNCEANGKVFCRDTPLYRCFAEQNNEARSNGLVTMLVPDTPFMRGAGYAMFFGSIFVFILSAFVALAMIGGAIYLYYYSEQKPLKRARKGALIFFAAGPILAFLAVLIGGIMMLISSVQTSPNPLWRIAAPKSETIPVYGFWLVLCNMLFMSITLCFSKFWKLRRQENARNEEKQREEDDAIMRAMGLDPDQKMASSSSSASSSDNTNSDSDSDSDDEKESLMTVPQMRQQQQMQRPMMAHPYAAQTAMYGHQQQRAPVYQGYGAQVY